jgi:hypothetical protein
MIMSSQGAFGVGSGVYKPWGAVLILPYGTWYIAAQISPHHASSLANRSDHSTVGRSFLSQSDPSVHPCVIPAVGANEWMNLEHTTCQLGTRIHHANGTCPTLFLLDISNMVLQKQGQWHITLLYSLILGR